MKYEAKTDAWIKIMYYATIILMLFPVFTVPSSEIFYYLISVVPVVVLVIWILLGSYYELREDEVFMKLGPIFGRVPYSNIKAVSLSSNWMSSWAMTSNKVEMKLYEKKLFKYNVQVGPIDREEFMDELIRRCRNLD